MKIDGLNWLASGSLRRAIAEQVDALERHLRTTVEVSALKDQAKAAEYWDRQIAEIKAAIEQLRDIET